MLLVSMNLWILLLLVAIGCIATLIALLNPPQERLRKMLWMGLFLALFDVVFETTGLLAGYWGAQNSVFKLGPAVPIEVFLIAICAGAALNLLLSQFSWKKALATSWLIATAGTAIEAMFVSAGNLVYTSGWTSYHAFTAYFLVFLFLQVVNHKWINAGKQLSYTPQGNWKKKR